MKKVFAIALALTLVLSISAVAFAAGSPTGGGSSSNVPVDVTEIVYGPASAVDKPIVRVVDKDGTEVTKITAEQEKQVDAVIDDAIKSGNAVVEAVYVEVPPETTEANPVTIIIELKEGEKVLIYAIDGSLQQTANREDLKNVEGDFYEITIPASCILVVAKQ
jgi:hypothetical protein